MSLPSPLSVGDAILLASMAYNVGKAFSSAPAEFGEVKDLLYSLNHSLKLLARALPQPPGEEEQGSPSSQAKGSADDETYITLANVHANCTRVLQDLQHFVDKYMILDTNAASGENERKWRDEIKKNWKKVIWTKEGGDIVKLKQTLTAHLQTLSLVIQVMNGDQQTKIQGRVETIHTRLGEIHEWFTQNLKTQRSSTSSTTQASQAVETSTVPRYLEFVVYEEVATPSGQQKVLVCPHATFEDPEQLLDENLQRPLFPKIFRCLCLSMNTERGPTAASDHSSQLAYTILPVSLLVQSIRCPANNQYTWQIYVYSPLSNSSSSLLLEEVPPISLAKFESWANRLRMVQAAKHVANNLNNSLVLTGDDSVSALNMKSNVSHFSGRVSVRFIANGTSFLVKQLLSLQLLHYGSIAWDFLHPGIDYERASCHFLPESYLSIKITLNQGGSTGEQSYSIQLHCDTPVSSFKGPRFVTLQGCLCTHESGGPSLESQSLNCSEVEFEFLDASMAQEYLGVLKAIKQRLLIYYLQQPRWGEQIVFQRNIGNHMIRNFVLSDAKLTIILNPSTDRYRMILSRSDQSAFICFELPQDFLEQVTTRTTAAHPNYPAWFVEVGKHSFSIVKQGSGIDPLSALRQDGGRERNDGAARVANST